MIAEANQRKMHRNAVPKARRVITRYVTFDYLLRLFRRSKPTIDNWIAYRGLPHVEIPGDGQPAVRFILSEVAAWAKKNKVEVFDVQRIVKEIAR